MKLLDFFGTINDANNVLMDVFGCVLAFNGDSDGIFDKGFEFAFDFVWDGGREE